MMKMMDSLIRKLSIDIETYSSADLNKSGVYRYAEAQDFEILLFGYSVNDGDVKVVDLSQGESIPPEIIEAIKSDNVLKYAFNAMFERVCLSRYLGFPTGKYLNPKSWRCTMIWSAYLGLPFSLKGVGAVLKLENQKLDEGKDLIKYFSVPCLPTKTNGGRTRNLPHHDFVKWSKFKFYNKRDVEVEIAIQNRLLHFPVPDFVWDEYHIDQEINDRGVYIDSLLVESAIKMSDETSVDISRSLQNLTNLENPNSVQQFRSWLSNNGVVTDELGKKTVKTLLKNSTAPDIKEALSLRLQLSKTSIKKYEAMKSSVCSDGRCHGMFQFYGANRTGRFAGRIVQLQNLPQNHIETLSEARELLKSFNLEALKVLYEDIPDTLSQLIRTAFIPKTGYKFIVCDYVAIEARVLAWLAGETWRIEAFERGDDIYCASASKMFHVPVVKHGINGELRQKGKIAELALGYGGSVGALTSMGALDMGLKEEELQPLVKTWRAANSKITAFWWKIDKLIKDAIKTKIPQKYGQIAAFYEKGILFVVLPSGRRLAYVKPKVTENQYGDETITYEGVGAAKKWERIESYGPKFVENIVQAISRDILCNAMKNLRSYRIVAHVHDELIVEAPKDMSLETIKAGMEKLPDWATGLLLRADGYETEFYKKD